ncbi:hypothetical protein AVEN_15860-1 [Araneus ventricosus]|uniref:Uncharacterized protein n=1 Tax=Araneus ventricosus TaxID=182803 RepID=A0A4Y2KLM9_ARAVE|nr:hypothetical protein AVEN_15860-1 [Araneus ventricosus]
MRTSSGTPIKFISGKTNLVLSFRKNLYKCCHNLPDFQSQEKSWRGLVIDCNLSIALHIIRMKLGMLIHTFLPIFSFNEDMGFFCSLRRYALPLIMQAGKYLGKRLLTSSRNIVEAVSQEKSFRHPASDQIHLSGGEIIAEILRKLRVVGGVKRKKSMRSHQTKLKKPSPTDIFSDL